MQTDSTYYFPFGQRLKKVEQIDRTPKKAFVLGVYASAVHAKWIDANGNLKVQALAVASEPEIFWTGGNAAEIIAEIIIPKELGRLLPANSNLNGPSGKALDTQYLAPLKLNRKTTWLCDLIPESRINGNQRKALDKHYPADLIQKYNLSPATIPDFTKDISNERREEILKELEQSKAETLILLGDQPIFNFLSFWGNSSYPSLENFGSTADRYGKSHELKINNKPYNVIPLCHPRQAFGYRNKKWKDLHDNWVNKLKKDS
jgi:hypothetical protein